VIELYVKNIEEVWFGVAYEGEHVLATSFGLDKKRTLEGLKDSISSKSGFEHVEKPSAFAEHIVSLAKNAYDGNGVSTAFILKMKHLSEHNRRVLYAVSLIPFGFVSSYGAVAKAVGTSPRAVGHAMATNPMAPIVPCHRVVGSDFSLVGYGGGLESKLKFLKRERKGFTSKREIPINGKGLLVFPVEFVLGKFEKST
jgi:O-6-methylguanine DNA methyltransferase